MDDSGEFEYGIVLGLIAAAATVIIGVVVLVVLLLGSIVIGSAISADEPAERIEIAETHSSETALEATPSPEPAVVAAPQPTPEPTPIPTRQPSAMEDIGRIAAINPEFQLITLDPDGSNQRTLSDSNQRAYQFPAWSPIGNSIATIHTNRQRTRGGITVFKDGAAPSTVVAYESDTSSPIYLSWSPNSELISFISPSEEGLEFQTVPPNGSEKPRLLGRGTPFYWDWTSDSRFVLIHRGSADNQDSEVGVINVATGQYQELNEDAGGYFQSPDIAPNDRDIAYAEGLRFSDRELILTDLQSNDRSTVDHSGTVALNWSPLGDQLAFISSEQRVNSTFGPLKLVTQDGEVSVLEQRTVLAFFWSPNGRRITYFMPPTASDAELEAALRRRRANPNMQSQEAFRVALWVVDTVTGEREQLGLFQPSTLFWNQFMPFFDQYAHSHSLWSPQSEAFIVPVNDDGTDIVYRFFVDGRLPTRVTDGSIAFWSHQ